jgi:hypothetical protein
MLAFDLSITWQDLEERLQRTTSPRQRRMRVFHPGSRMSWAATSEIAQAMPGGLLSEVEVACSLDD